MFVERRRTDRDRRGAGRVPVVFAVRNEVNGKMQLGQAEDIGPSGITLRRPRDLPVLPQTSVTLTFDLPGSDRTIEATGQVVTDRRYGPFRRTGVRFLDVSAEHLALLSDFCRHRSFVLAAGQARK